MAKIAHTTVYLVASSQFEITSTTKFVHSDKETIDAKCYTIDLEGTKLLENETMPVAASEYITQIQPSKMIDGSQRKIYFSTKEGAVEEMKKLLPHIENPLPNQTYYRKDAHAFVWFRSTLDSDNIELQKVNLESLFIDNQEDGKETD